MALRGRQSGVDLKPPQAAVVKSNGGERCGNAGTGFRQARLREASASEPSMKCRKRIRRCQNRGLTLPPGSARENPEVCPSGIRHVDGAKLNQALVWNVRTYTAMLREKAQAAPTARPKVPMRQLGAHCLVVVMKRGNARGGKGVGHQRWIGSTGNGRSPIINGRRQPSLGGTSRMMREYHVRICEGLGVKFPGSTRQFRTHAAFNQSPRRREREWVWQRCARTNL